MRRLLLMMLLVLCGVFPAFAQTATPAGGDALIEVTPDTVGLHETVTVTGTGFTAGQMVAAFIGFPETGMTGEPLTSVEVGDDGAFTLSFTMPDSMPSGAPIFQRDLLVVIAADFQPIASAPFTYDISPEELGWLEHYNAMFDFSVQTPPDWTAGGGTDGFGFILPGSEDVGLTARAIALPQDVDADAVMNMTLEAYIEASPDLELEMEGIAEVTFESLEPVTTRSGEQGMVAAWTAQDESGETVLNGKTAYFDLNQMNEGYLFRTIQIRSADPAGLIFFDAVVDSYLRGGNSEACAVFDINAEPGAVESTPEPCTEVTPESNEVSWAEAEQMILNGEVAMIFQAHSLEVVLTLKDGSHVLATEPTIDEIFRVVQACGETCADIVMATE